MRFNPPFTGNSELDEFLLSLSRYVSDLDTGLSVNEGTGLIGSAVGNTLTFLQRYLHVKFANDNVGTGFSDNQTNKLYFGLFNSDVITESLLHYEYSWVPATFGPSNKLWYKTLGGRQVQFFVGAAGPDAGFQEVTNPAIDLDAVLANIADYSITNIKLADNSVDTRVLANDAVFKENMANDSVGLDELDTTGTPTAGSFLNGAMQWVVPQSGWYLAQTVIDDDVPITDSELGGHYYVDAAAVLAIGRFVDNSAAIGKTLVLVNTTALPAYITYNTGTILLLEDGTEQITLVIGPNGKATLLKVESNLWVAEGLQLTTSVFDPGEDYLATESLDTIITEGSVYIILE